MTKLLIGITATLVMVVGAFLEPERRYPYLLLFLLGLILTHRSHLEWREKRAG